MTFYRTSIFVVFQFFIVFISAQSRDYLDLKTHGGYEYNYFRSPDKVLMDNEFLPNDQFLASSTYQDFYLDYDFYYKWNNSQIKFGITPETRLFYENFDDSYWQVGAEVIYYYDFSEKVEFTTEVNFHRKDRQGIDGDIDVLFIPLGYLEYGAVTGLEFEPLVNNETKIEVFYKFKNYDNFGAKDLEYDEYGIGLDSEQKFTSNELTHTYGFSTYFKTRLYNTFDASDEIPEGERDWSYLKADLYYEFPLSKYLSVEPSLEYWKRIDNGRNRAGFNEIGPSLKLDFDNDKFDFWTSIEYLRRKYDSIEARDTDGGIGEQTKFGYTNFRLVGDYILNEHWSITADVYSRIRSSNYTNLEARSFRAYRNQYAGLGIKWKM